MSLDDLLYPPTVGTIRVVERGEDASEFLERLFAPIAAGLRVCCPEEYAHVDRIKAEPGWMPQNGSGRIPELDFDPWVMAECLWCGDDFVAKKIEVEKGNGRFCTAVCREDHRAWEKRRSNAMRIGTDGLHHGKYSGLCVVCKKPHDLTADAVKMRNRVGNPIDRCRSCLGKVLT